VKAPVAPIRAFVGLNGSGKTLAAMHYSVVPALDAGLHVWATMPIHHEHAHIVRSWRDLIGLHDCVLLLDEITSALPSRQAMSLPPELARLFNQLRKVNVALAWTAPNWARADKLLREVTSIVTVCKGFYPERHWTDPVTGERVKASREWPRNRLFRFKTYSAEDFDEFTLAKTVKLKAVQRRYYYRPSHRAHTLYETLDPVQLLDHVDDVGMCVLCNKSRKRAYCACTPEARAEAAGALAPRSLGPEAVVHEQHDDIDSLDARALLFGAEHEHDFWDAKT
jgi:hypothetical protein